MHAHLFGGRRFALFPVFVASVTAGTAAFFALAGAATGTLVLGLHVIVGLLGLQVGTVGFEGRDAMENLLGDTTLLLFSARTLPVSQRRLLIAFLVKDVGYYVLLFVAPLAVGMIPLAILGDLPADALPVVFVTTAGMFALGVAASVALVGLATRSRPATFAVVLAVGVAGVVRSEAVLSITPYGLYASPSMLAVAGTLLVPVALAAAGIALFRFDRRTPARTAHNQFRTLHRRFGPYDRQGTLSKSLIDVARSSGGLWKVVFSQGIVFVVLAVLLAFLPDVIPVRPAPGLTLSAILSMGTFTTYNWLCQFEDAAFYLRYPVELTTVFRGKLYGFVLLAIPTGLAYLALGGVLFGVRSMVVGLLTFPPLALYVFGVTAYVAGLRPTELLFDTPTFAAFTAAELVVLLPLVVAAIAYPLAPFAIAAGAVALSVLAGVVGYGLYRRAGPRWNRKIRAGTS